MSCMSCKHFRMYDQETRESFGEDGECRAHPPVLLVDAIKKRFVSLWPNVGRNDSCGEYATESLEET